MLIFAGVSAECVSKETGICNGFNPLNIYEQTARMVLSCYAFLVTYDMLIPNFPLD